MSFFNFSGFLSPPKRELTATSPTRPFCTSPSQFQEVTLDQDVTFSNTMGLRSPGGPMRGRSVKEIEEQLSNLKKENFNLKLRIYFLEEKMGTNFTLDKDNIVKKNIELQIDIANLQKEVQEKHELLCQAVKAMELEDEEHKKYIANKEEEMNMCQQELEDLRMQLQETKFDSDGISLKSDTTGFYSSRATNSGNNVNDLQEKIKLLETELHMEKENNASLQFAISQTETLRSRYENMQKENEKKDETIKNLHMEIENANEKIVMLTNQLTDCQEKMDVTLRENHSLAQKLQAESKRLEEVTCQHTDIRKKYTMVRSELEREQKKAERTKILNDMRIAECEDENQKQKMKIKDLQAKLEAALVEIRKNQNLAVSKSLVQKTNISHTDPNSISVQNTAASPGAPQEDSLHVQVAETSLDVTPLSSSSSPSKKLLDTSERLEELLLGPDRGASNDKILSCFMKMKKENAAQSQKIIKLKSEQMKACEIIKTMMESRNKANEEINKLKGHVKELEHELESVVTHPANEGDNVPLKQRVTEMNIKAVQGEDEKSMADTQCTDKEVSELYKALVNELETKIEVLVATLNEKDSQMQKIREQHEEILTSLEDKENRIVDLEFELISVHQDGRDVDQSLLDKSDSSSEKHSSFYRQEMEEKDREIKRLNEELRKCTCYLQEIVNKELWDKNKEVEKLRSKQTSSPEMAKLKKDLQSKDQQLKILKEKISELGLDIDVNNEELGVDIKTTSLPSSNTVIHQITALQDELKVCKEEREYFKERLKEFDSQTGADLIKKLQTQNESLKTELEKSEELRFKSNEICSILNTRLEELAVFLDSLLKQKLILGFLGRNKERKLREIINTSLDLSKSFAMSMIINPDQSLAQLSNISSLLNGSAFQDLTLDPPQTDSGLNEESEGVLKIIPESITLTYQNHLYKCGDGLENKEELITALRQQIFSLKSELQLRDNELNKMNTFKEFSDKSTDTDLESKQRLSSSKLFSTPKSNNTSTTLKYKSEVQSESDGWSEPDRMVSRARIGLNQSVVTVIKGKVDESTEDETRHSSTPTKKSFEKRQSFTDLHQQIAKLQEEVENKTEQLRNAEQKLVTLIDLDSKLTETKNKLKDTEKNRMEIEKQVVSLKSVIDNLNVTNKELKETMLDKDKETQNRINQLLVEKDQATLLAEKFEKELLEAKSVMEEVEGKLHNAEKEKFELETHLRQECMQFTVSKLKTAEEEFIKKLKSVESKAEEEIKNVQDKCERECMKKSQVEGKLNEINRLRSELNDLKGIVKSYEETIQCYRGKEDEFKKKSQEYQEKINTLRKEIDGITLQYSEAVLEKTKLANEKAHLEQEFNKNTVRAADLKQQFGDISTEFEKVRSEHQKQIGSLQKQKSSLEMKISELESINADLHNKLVRLQAGHGDFNLSLPNFDTKNSQLMYKRQFSDQPYSSEDNIEECSGHNFAHPAVRNLQPVDLERQEANSSPDLGIESDHGRFSSLETHTHLPRPLLQTLELTESMNNLLSAENAIPLDAVNCDSDHCCQRILEIAHENNDLKRKLNNMRRALQETLNQLNLANQRKKQVEKTICKQIHKTSQVLRKAKANLDSGSESDMLKM